MDLPELREIPLDEIEIGLSQARSHDIEKNIDQLSESIRKRGLLQPITVFRNSNSKYEIVMGQRRFLACQKLGFVKIPSIVVKTYEDVILAKMDSITENEIREDMHIQDKTQVCTELYYKYGSVKAVSEELGWQPQLVAKYVRLARLPGTLKREVSEGRLSQAIALNVLDALSAHDGDVDELKAFELAVEIQRMNPAQREASYNIIRLHPNQTLDIIIEKAKETKPYEDITLKVLREDLRRVKKYAQENDRDDVEEAIIELARESLFKLGY